MKEIHATQNQDGTYYVSIITSSAKSKMVGKSEVKELVTSTIEISRAEIAITAYSNDLKNGEMLKLEVKDDG